MYDSPSWTTWSYINVKCQDISNSWMHEAVTEGRLWPRKSEVKGQRDPAAVPSCSGPHSVILADLVLGAAYLSTRLSSPVMPLPQLEQTKDLTWDSH